MNDDNDTPAKLSKDELDKVRGGLQRMQQNITLDNGIKKSGNITLDNGIKKSGNITLDNGIKKNTVFEPNDKN